MMNSMEMLIVSFIYKYYIISSNIYLKETIHMILKDYIDDMNSLFEYDTKNPKKL